MVALFKSLIPAALLTWIVASAIGSQGSRGGVLLIFRFSVEQHTLFWSWPLFIAALGLAWAILFLMD
jgi:hypothetical protein